MRWPISEAKGSFWHLIDAHSIAQMNSGERQNIFYLFVKSPTKNSNKVNANKDFYCAWSGWDMKSANTKLFPLCEWKWNFSSCAAKSFAFLKPKKIHITLNWLHPPHCLVCFGFTFERDVFGRNKKLSSAKTNVSIEIYLSKDISSSQRKHKHKQESFSFAWKLFRELKQNEVFPEKKWIKFERSSWSFWCLMETFSWVACVSLERSSALSVALWLKFNLDSSHVASDEKTLKTKEKEVYDALKLRTIPISTRLTIFFIQ